MSKEIREQINKIKNWKQLLNENLLQNNYYIGSLFEALDDVDIFVGVGAFVRQTKFNAKRGTTFKIVGVDSGTIKQGGEYIEDDIKNARRFAFIMVGSKSNERFSISREQLETSFKHIDDEK